MELTLVREYFPKATNGTLYLGVNRFCYTIELPWQKNERKVSCIPEGKYALSKRYTPKFGHHLWVMNVPGRTNILIHAFNDAPAESKGCIAPVASLTGTGKGSFSRDTLEKLTKLVYEELDHGKQVYLTIKAAL